MLRSDNQNPHSGNWTHHLVCSAVTQIQIADLAAAQAEYNEKIQLFILRVMNQNIPIYSAIKWHARACTHARTTHTHTHIFIDLMLRHQIYFYTLYTKKLQIQCHYLSSHVPSYHEMKRLLLTRARSLAENPVLERLPIIMLGDSPAWC